MTHILYQLRNASNTCLYAPETVSDCLQINQQAFLEQLLGGGRGEAQRCLSQIAGKRCVGTAGPRSELSSADVLPLMFTATDPCYLHLTHEEAKTWEVKWLPQGHELRAGSRADTAGCSLLSLRSAEDLHLTSPAVTSGPPFSTSPAPRCRPHRHFSLPHPQLTGSCLQWKS